MGIGHEIASLKFQQLGLTTNGKEYKQIQQEIFALQYQNHLLSSQST